MTEIQVRTAARRQMVDVTSKINEALAASGVADGMCQVFVPHTTAAVTINESADPDVPRDLLAAFEALVPNIPFAHGEGNSDAHLLATVIGSSVLVPVVDGSLRLGTWQGIFLVELDGPRSRRLWVHVR